MTLVMFGIAFALGALVVVLSLRKRSAGVASRAGNGAPAESCTTRCRCRH